MREHLKEASGPGLAILGIGIDVLDLHPTAGWVLVVLGVAVTFWVFLDKRRQSRPENGDGSKAEHSSPPAKSWELSEDEKLVLTGIEMEVQFHHGHSDFWGLVEDLRDGKRLSDGPCTRCHEIRNTFPAERNSKKGKKR